MDTPNDVQGFIEAIKKYGLEHFGVYYGTYRGFVVDNADPQKSGRLKLRVPQIGSSNTLEYWAWPKGQVAGEDFGDFMIPPKESPVWVEFENGDPQHPIWLGGWWGSAKGLVPAEGILSEPKNRVRKSEKWIIEMDDVGNKVKISSKANPTDFIMIDLNRDITINNGRDENISAGRHINITAAGNKSESVEGNSSESVTGNSSESVTGNKSITCSIFSVTALQPGTFNLGGASISYGASSITFAVGGSSIVIDGSGVTIMGKDFITHHHSGVQVGGGNTGGVV